MNADQSWAFCVSTKNEMIDDGFVKPKVTASNNIEAPPGLKPSILSPTSWDAFEDMDTEDVVTNVFCITEKVNDFVSKVNVKSKKDKKAKELSDEKYMDKMIKDNMNKMDEEVAMKKDDEKELMQKHSKKYTEKEAGKKQ